MMKEHYFIGAHDVARGKLQPETRFLSRTLRPYNVFDIEFKRMAPTENSTLEQILLI